MNPKAIKAISILAGIICALLILGAAGNADFHQAKLAENAYCERVKAGYHRDWNNRIDCGLTGEQLAAGEAKVQGQIARAEALEQFIKEQQLR